MMGSAASSTENEMENTELEWQYSRNQLKHWVCDGFLYLHGEQNPFGFELFEIKTSRREREIRKPTDTYRLLHKGKIVDMHRLVRVLKESAKRIADMPPNVELTGSAALSRCPSSTPG